jgi:sortase A
VTIVVESVADYAVDLPPAAPPRWNAAAFSRAAGVVLCSVAVAVTCFLAEVTVLGRFEQNHDQQVEYDQLRNELANGIAPISAYDYQGTALRIGAPVALLSIPEIGLSEVVGEGTTSGVLEAGPGHLRDTVLPGQAGTSVIMGREAAYGGPFRYINQLQASDTFTVTTGQGVSTYRVIDVRYAGDQDPPPADSKTGRLTLITASGTSYMPSDELRVDAQLISAVQPSPGGPTIAVSPAEAAMAGEDAGGTLILFWAQALILATSAVFWARKRWGRLQTWLIGVPLLAYLGLTLADQVARLLPNLL